MSVLQAFCLHGVYKNQTHQNRVCDPFVWMLQMIGYDTIAVRHALQDEITKANLDVNLTRAMIACRFTPTSFQHVLNDHAQIIHTDMPARVYGQEFPALAVFSLFCSPDVSDYIAISPEGVDEFYKKNYHNKNDARIRFDNQLQEIHRILGIVWQDHAAGDFTATAILRNLAYGDILSVEEDDIKSDTDRHSKRDRHIARVMTNHRIIEASTPNVTDDTFVILPGSGVGGYALRIKKDLKQRQPLTAQTNSQILRNMLAVEKDVQLALTFDALFDPCCAELSCVIWGDFTNVRINTLVARLVARSGCRRVVSVGCATWNAKYVSNTSYLNVHPALDKNRELGIAAMIVGLELPVKAGISSEYVQTNLVTSGTLLMGPGSATTRSWLAEHDLRQVICLDPNDLPGVRAIRPIATEIGSGKYRGSTKVTHLNGNTVQMDITNNIMLIHKPKADDPEFDLVIPVFASQSMYNLWLQKFVASIIPTLGVRTHGYDSYVIHTPLGKIPDNSNVARGIIHPVVIGVSLKGLEFGYTDQSLGSANDANALAYFNSWKVVIKKVSGTRFAVVKPSIDVHDSMLTITCDNEPEADAFCSAFDTPFMRILWDAFAAQRHVHTFLRHFPSPSTTAQTEAEHYKYWGIMHQKREIDRVFQTL